MQEALSPAILKVCDVSWVQGNTLILNKIRWEVKKHENWAFPGLIGCVNASLQEKILTEDNLSDFF